MNGNAELECLADTCGFNARPYAAPESCVEQNHINRNVEHVSRKLLEVDDDRVSGERHPYLLAHATHPGHAKHRVFEVIITNALDLLSEPNGRLRGPHGVWIEAKTVTVQRSGKLTIAFELVLGREHSTLQLVRSESATLLQLPRIRDELLDGPDLALTI